MNDVNLGQFEILDRTDLILYLMQTKLYEHKSLTKKQTKKVDKAMELLGEVYQLAGAECSK